MSQRDGTLRDGSVSLYDSGLKAWGAMRLLVFAFAASAALVSGFVWQVSSAQAATTCQTSGSAYIGSNCTLDPSDVSSGTALPNGGRSYTYTSLIVQGGVTVTAGSRTAPGQVYIYSSGDIDVEGTVSAVGMTTGTPSDGAYGGTQNAGSGGNNALGDGSKIHGDIKVPVDLGHTGGGTYGYGGGAIRIGAAGAFKIGNYGAIDASGYLLGDTGNNGQEYRFGSGGSVEIDAGYIDNSTAGKVKANGGDYNYYSFYGRPYGGGGGRIAIYENSSAPIPWALSVAGGAGNGGTSGVVGAPGTIFTQKAGDTYGNLMVDFGSMSTYGVAGQAPGTSYTFDSVTVTHAGAGLGASYWLPGSSSIAVTGTFALNGTLYLNTWNQVNLGGTVNVGNGALSGEIQIGGTNTDAKTYAINVLAKNINVTSTGKIGGNIGPVPNAVGTGYSGLTSAAGYGPGPGTWVGDSWGAGGGGAHYGAGGTGSDDSGNPKGAGGGSYDSPPTPTEMGSAGGGGSWYPGGAGGGYIRLEGTNSIAVTGTITANGANAIGTFGGNGGGGTVILLTHALSGTGPITAKGGANSFGGCGGGGLVVLDYDSSSYTIGSASAAAGCSSGIRAGGDGYVHAYGYHGVTVTAPNGSESLNGGQSYGIAWNHTGTVDHYRISLSTDSGATFPTTVVASTVSSPYSWTVTSAATTHARIRVEALDASNNVLASDTSDADFSIIVNHAPVAVNDSYTTNENTTLTVPASGVLSNDSDADGDPITAVLASGPVHGTLTLNANGSFTYVPNANWNGADAFSYTAYDGSLDSAPATATITVVADTTPPTITIASPVDGYLTNQTSVTVSGTASDVGTGVASVTANGVACTLTGSDYSCVNVPLLAEGANVLTVTAADNAGNVATAGVTVTRDTQAPVVSIVAPLEGTLTTQTEVTVAWTVDGVAQTSLTSENLVEGDNAITRTATDAAGNVGSAMIHVTLDTIAPVVAIDSPADGFVTNHSPIDVAWTVDGAAQTTQLTQNLVEGDNAITRSFTNAAGNTGTAVIHVILNTQAPVVAITAPANGFLTNNPILAVAWTVDGVAQTTQLTQDLVEGDNVITRTATDAASNVGTATVHVTLDTQAPVVAITAPANGALVKAATVDVTGTASDANGIASIKVGGTACSYVSGSWTCSAFPLAEGSNTLTATVTDAAGNSAAAVVTVTRDTTAPAVAIVSPADGTTLNTATVNVTGTASDANGIASVKVNGTACSYATGNWSCSGLTLVEGSNVLSTVATDAAGNVGTASVAVMVVTYVPPPLYCSQLGQQITYSPNFFQPAQCGVTAAPGKAVLLNSSCAPIVGARVNLRKADGTYITYALTGADGSASFSSYLGGTASRFEVDYNGATWSTPSGSLAAGAVIQTRPVAVSFVGSNCQAIVGARVNLRKADGTYVTYALTGASGVASFETVPGASMKLEVDYNGAQWMSAASANGTEVIVGADRFALSFLGSSGAPIPGARVNLRKADGTYVTYALTGADGLASFNVVPAANERLEVDYNGAQYMTAAATVNADTAIPVVAKALSMVFTSSTGAPIPGARVNLRKADGTYVTYALTGADGTATFQVVPGASMKLEIDYNGAQYLTATTTVQFSTSLTVHAVALTVRLTATGSPIVGARVNLRKADSTYVTYALTGADGSVTFNVVPGATHRVDAAYGGATWTSDPTACPASIVHGF